MGIVWAHAGAMECIVLKLAIEFCILSTDLVRLGGAEMCANSSNL